MEGTSLGVATAAAGAAGGVEAVLIALEADLWIEEGEEEEEESGLRFSWRGRNIVLCFIGERRFALKWGVFILCMIGVERSDKVTEGIGQAPLKAEACDN